MEYQPDHLKITAWAEEDRPREKLLQKGKSALSDAELIAILIATGSGKETAVDLAKKILNSVGNNLLELSKLNIKELTNHKGIGEAKAISIMAALELGRRTLKSEVLEKPIINSSTKAYNYIQAHLSSLAHEEFMVLFLNQKAKLICHEIISKGGMTATVVDMRLLLRKAIEHKAVSLVLAHNHPSGNLKPSDADIKLTNKIKESFSLLDISLFDHLIIGENGFYSFAEDGRL